MKLDVLWFRIILLLIFLSLLSSSASCGATFAELPSVSESKVFHTLEETDVAFGGSRNVSVEQLPGGLRKVTSPEGVQLSEAGWEKASLQPNPEERALSAEAVGYRIFPTSPDGSIAILMKLSLGADSSVLAWLPNSPRFDPVTVFGFLPGLGIPLSVNAPANFLLGAPGSTNLSVSIDPAVGGTEVAGLRFSEAVMLNVWENGIVEQNRENVSVLDIHGQRWTSKRVRIGERPAILLVQD